MEQSCLDKDTKLQATMDSLQKGFFCSDRELTVWRNSLFYRYSAISEESVKVETSDYDSQDELLSLSTWIAYPTPASLSKSVIRLFVDDCKRITLTLYFGKQGKGTLLCQGSDCQQWDEEECEVLKHLVSDFCQSEDLQCLQNRLISQPVSFLQDVLDVIQLSSPMLYTSGLHISLTPKLDVDNPKDHGVDNLKDNAIHTHDKNTKDINENASNDSLALPAEVSFHTTTNKTNDNSVPEINPQEECTTGAPTTQRGSTPRSRKSSTFRKLLKRDRRRTMCPRRLYDKTTSQKLQTLEDNQDVLATELGDIQKKVLSHLEDMKIAIKNEIKHHINQKCENLNITMENICGHISKLENQIALLSKDNQSLKTHIGSLQATIKQRMTKTLTVHSSTQCNIQSTANSQDNRTEQATTDAEATTTSDQQTITEMPSSHEDHAIKAVPRDPRHCSPTENKSYTPSVSTQNRFEMLSTQNGDTEKHEQLGCQDNSEHRSENNPQGNKQSQSYSHPSPSQTLSTVKIPSDASSILLGDSVLRYIDQRRLGTGEDRVFKLCVPGITSQDMTNWLQSLTDRHDHIKHVIVHIGVNDCPAGAISRAQWENLILLCKDKFQSADITLSSIIPARGRHALNNAIFPSNRNLSTACNSSQVRFLDNHDTFVTPNGAPRLALYKDAIHLSSKGTAKLAVNFMRNLPRFLRQKPANYFNRRRKPERAIHEDVMTEPVSETLYYNNPGRNMRTPQPPPARVDDACFPPVVSMDHYPVLTANRNVGISDNGPYGDELHHARHLDNRTTQGTVKGVAQPSDSRYPQDSNTSFAMEEAFNNRPSFSTQNRYPFYPPAPGPHPYPHPYPREYPDLYKGYRDRANASNKEQDFQATRDSIQPQHYAFRLLNMATQILNKQSTY